MAHALVKKRKSKTRIGLSRHKGQLMSAELGDHRKGGRDLLQGVLSSRPYIQGQQPTPSRLRLKEQSPCCAQSCPQLSQEVDRGSRDGSRRNFTQGKGAAGPESGHGESQAVRGLEDPLGGAADHGYLLHTQESWAAQGDGDLAPQGGIWGMAAQWHHSNRATSSGDQRPL